MSQCSSGGGAVGGEGAKARDWQRPAPLQIPAAAATGTCHHAAGTAAINLKSPAHRRLFDGDGDDGEGDAGDDSSSSSSPSSSSSSSSSSSRSRQRQQPQQLPQGVPAPCAAGSACSCASAGARVQRWLDSMEAASKRSSRCSGSSQLGLPASSHAAPGSAGSPLGQAAPPTPPTSAHASHDAAGGGGMMAPTQPGHPRRAQGASRPLGDEELPPPAFVVLGVLGG